MSTTKALDKADLSKRLVRSQKFFNRATLFVYDVLLYGFISPFLWGCNKKTLINNYQSTCGKNHLDVGVGTGFLLDQAEPNIETLALMDLNQTCLDKTAKRLARFSPITWQRNILTPLRNIDHQFDTISLNYVMHCIPDGFTKKGIAFFHLKMLLQKNGILFGATVLQTQQSSAFSRGLMKTLNLIGLFSNCKDTPDELEHQLKLYFNNVRVVTFSSCALFYATDNTEFIPFSQYRAISNA